MHSDNHDNDDATLALQHLQISDGTTLAYRELGEDANGEPRDVMMLLHGWPTSSYLWRGVMPEIAAHASPCARPPRLRGSDKPRRRRFGFADFERAIDGFLNALGVNEVAVAGHDLGGPIAMHWALRNPGRVRGVVMLNTLLYPDFHPSVFEFVTTLATPATRDELTAPEGLAGMMRAGVADGSVLADTVLAAVAALFADAADRLTLARAGIGLEAERVRGDRRRAAVAARARPRRLRHAGPHPARCRRHDGAPPARRTPHRGDGARRLRSLPARGAARRGRSTPRHVSRRWPSRAGTHAELWAGFLSTAGTDPAQTVD
ncbi:MAG: alpha/beta fold hydrolase [Ilumatobacteraceae bacterium]